MIVMLGGHTEIASDYVSRCVERLVSGRFACVGGPIETIGETFSSKVIALAMSSTFGVGGVSFRMNNIFECEVDTVAFGAYRRSVFEKCGLIDEEMIRNQDDEFNYRLRKCGYRILLTPSIRSKYYSRSSIKSLWSQYFRYGYWKVRVSQKRPRQMQPRHFIPAIFISGLFMAMLSAIFSELGRVLLILFGVLYTVANLSASIMLLPRGGLKALMLLPVTFVTLHFSYGTGFAIGLLRFWNGWGNQTNRFSARDEAREVRTANKPVNAA